jgi:hypothetical protein
VTSAPISRLLAGLGTRTAGHGVQIFFVAVVVWVIAVFVLITVEPKAGARSPEELQAAVRASVAGQDADQLGRLFAPDTVGDGYPATLLTRLADAGSWNAEVRYVGDGQELVLSGTSGCIGWGLTRAGDRWYLDGVPLLSGPCPQ